MQAAVGAPVVSHLARRGTGPSGAVRLLALYAHTARGSRPTEGEATGPDGLVAVLPRGRLPQQHMRPPRVSDASGRCFCVPKTAQDLPYVWGELCLFTIQ